MNCKTDISAALPQNTDTIHMDLMTDEELHAKLQKGYDDIEAGKVQNASRSNLSKIQEETLA